MFQDGWAMETKLAKNITLDYYINGLALKKAL